MSTSSTTRSARWTITSEPRCSSRSSERPGFCAKLPGSSSPTRCSTSPRLTRSWCSRRARLPRLAPTTSSCARGWTLPTSWPRTASRTRARMPTARGSPRTVASPWTPAASPSTVASPPTVARASREGRRNPRVLPAPRARMTCPPRRSVPWATWAAACTWRCTTRRAPTCPSPSSPFCSRWITAARRSLTTGSAFGRRTGWAGRATTTWPSTLASSCSTGSPSSSGRSYCTSSWSGLRKISTISSWTGSSSSRCPSSTPPRAAA
mmetsp:Transcript_6058/g.27152  ORF Transcript_6058/g.27152 Transcript_6058/m.27152 type:complete len:265 (-) Transcript_6058:2241-3035(-)